METNYSVLMSVYQGEKPAFLNQSLDSIFNQTIIPSQFVLVKNGPLTSELENVLLNYSSKYPGILFFVELKNNEPLGVALDFGLSFCKCEYVARMDSDDIAEKERCAKQLKCFEDNQFLDICGTFMGEFYDDDRLNVKTIRIVPENDVQIKKFLRRRSPFNHSSVMFKKASVIRCGGYGQSRRKEDFDLFSRMLNMGCMGYNIPETLMLGRANVNSFKRKKSWIYCSDYIEVMKRNWKSGYCSFWDFLVVSVYQLLIFLTPTFVSRWFTNKFLRKKVLERRKIV